LADLACFGAGKKANGQNERLGAENRVYFGAVGRFDCMDLWAYVNTMTHKGYTIRSIPFYLGDSMKAARTSIFLLTIYVVSMLAAAAPAVAQGSPTPNIDIQCSPSNIEIDVYPGSSRLGSTTCTATNPTNYAEDVSITVQSDGLGYAAPGSLTVPPLGQIDFDITVRGELRAPEGTRELKVSAVVTNANGVANPQPVTKTVAIMVVLVQFSRLQVEAEEPFTQLRPYVDYTFVFNVHNQGNAMDKFKVEVTENSMARLEDAGFQVQLPLVSTEIESQSPPQKIRVLVRTPKNQGWTDQYYQLEFQATSDFSCRTENACNTESQQITIYVRGIYLPGFEIIPTLSMLAFAASVAFRRINDEDDDEDGDGRKKQLSAE
jgi:hypothetical protein